MGDLLQPGDGEGKSLCLVLESWLGMQVSTKNEQQLQLKPHSGGLEIQQQEKKKNPLNRQSIAKYTCSSD